MARVVLAIISTLLAVALWSTMGCASSTQTSYAPGTINNDVMGWVFVKAAVYDSLLLSHHYEPTTGWRATIMWYHGMIPLTMVHKGGVLCYETRGKTIATAGHLVVSDLVTADCRDYMEATADLTRAVLEYGEAQPLEQAFR